MWWRNHRHADSAGTRLSALPPRAASLALSAYYFAYFAYVGAYSPYITLYLNDIGLAATQIGVLYAIPQVMRIFGPAAWGILADRLGTTATILRLAAVLAWLSFCGLYLGTSFTWVFAVLIAMHFFTSAQMPLIETITLDHVCDTPGQYGRIRVWGSVGFILSVLGLGYLLDHLAVATVLHVVAVLLLATVLAAWIVPERGKSGRAAGGVPLAAILARPAVQGFLAAGFLNAFAHAALYTFYSIHLKEHGYSASTIGWMWSIGVLIEIGVFQYMPQITRHFRLESLYFSTFVVCAVRFMIIGWSADVFWLLVIAQTMHAFTFAVYHASAVGLVARHFGPRHQARGQALFISVSYGAGGFTGGIACGLMWDAFGAQWTFTASAIAGALGAGVLALSRRGAPRVAG